MRTHSTIANEGATHCCLSHWPSARFDSSRTLPLPFSWTFSKKLLSSSSFTAWPPRRHSHKKKWPNPLSQSIDTIITVLGTFSNVLHWLNTFVQSFKLSKACEGVRFYSYRFRDRQPYRLWFMDQEWGSSRRDGVTDVVHTTHSHTNYSTLKLFSCSLISFVHAKHKPPAFSQGVRLSLLRVSRSSQSQLSPRVCMLGAGRRIRRFLEILVENSFLVQCWCFLRIIFLCFCFYFEFLLSFDTSRQCVVVVNPVRC